MILNMFLFAFVFFCSYILVLGSERHSTGFGARFGSTLRSRDPGSNFPNPFRSFFAHFLDFGFGIFGLGSSVEDLWFGIFGLGSLAWDLWPGEIGSWGWGNHQAEAGGPRRSRRSILGSRSSRSSRRSNRRISQRSSRRNSRRSRRRSSRRNSRRRGGEAAGVPCDDATRGDAK